MKFKIETTGKIQTPMQEALETYEAMLSLHPEMAVSVRSVVEDLKSHLEKERETICNAFSDAQHGAVESRWTAEEYFEEVFNNK